jgi:hypothetical protein
MSNGNGSKGDDWLVDVVDSKLSCLAVVDNHDSPKVIRGVAPPSQDGFSVKGDFATCFVKKYLAACIAQDGNGEDIVDKARELMI